MLQLENNTPFAVQITVLPDADGVDTLYVVVAATFALAGSTLVVASAQRPVQTADTYRGDPARSSLERAGAIHLLKPSTDVILLGEAWAPRSRPAPQVDVTVSVGPVHKMVRVFGDREWKGLVDARISAPAPFERMPLVYERAFGGVLMTDSETGTPVLDRRNPAGVGFALEGRRGGIGSRTLPNLEDPAHLITDPAAEPPPAGFGQIAPFWEPRRSFTGTYDDAWRKTRAPYLPRDFNPRFFNTAHTDLICKGHLKGGEPVSVINASPSPFQLRLPRCDFDGRARIARKVLSLSFQLESVVLEPGELIVSMLWRGAVSCDKRPLQIEGVRLALQHLDLGGRAA
jgi:hypothetical protein